MKGSQRGGPPENGFSAVVAAAYGVAMVTLEFHDDAATFLAAAGAHLAADPLVATVVATTAEREARRAAAAPGSSRPPDVRWFLAVRDDAGEVVGAAMRTAPFAPHPAYVLPLPPGAGTALAEALHARGEFLGGVNGALPAAREVADATARLWGTTARVDERLRLHELGELVVPPAPEGRLRLAGPDDVRRCGELFRAFDGEAAAQAGRAAGHDGEHFSDEDVAARIADGLVHLWVLDDGTEGGLPVHLTARNAPARGVVRIGPVLTPREHRGRGYAARAVAEVSALARDAGHRVVLFTDLDNPVSGPLYARLGYEPVVDTANHVVEPPPQDCAGRAGAAPQ